MKVLHVVPSVNPNFGGVSQAVRTLIVGLYIEGIQNQVVSLDDPQSDYIKSSVIKIHAVGRGTGPWHYHKSFYPWLIQNLKLYDKVILHGLWQYPGYALYKALNKIAQNRPELYIMTHGMLDPYFQKSEGRKLKAIRNVIYWKLVEQKLVNFADGILFTCEEEKRLAEMPFLPYHPKSELVVGLGVEEPPEKSHHMMADFYARFPELQNQQYLLFLGRIDEKKGIVMLIQAYKQFTDSLLEKDPSLVIPKLLIAGPGLESVYGKQLLKLAESISNSSNQIIFPGMLSGNLKWGAYYGCEAFVLPSHQENFGIAVVEALACSKPVLISNQVNIWEDIVKGGAGIAADDTLYGTGNLLKFWHDLSSNEKLAMGENARKTFEHRFALEIVMKQYVKKLNLREVIKKQNEPKEASVFPVHEYEHEVKAKKTKECTTDKKKVLILGINFAPELTGIGKYTGEMVDWLVDEDYQVTMVTSFPYYPNWSVHKPYSGRWFKKETEKEGKLTVFRCPMYIPIVPSGLKRVLQEFTFFICSFFIIFYLLFKKKHDQIFVMAPPFHLGFLSLFYRFFKGGKIDYHVHDMQIESARQLRIIKGDIAFRILFRLEKYILNSVDYVSTISGGMKAKIQKKVQRDIIMFPNWVDTQKLFPITDRQSLKKAWGFNVEDKIILYSGSIGEKQGLQSLVPIAKSLQAYKFIKFVICGIGPYKEHLIKLVYKERLDNIFFLPLQPLEQFNSLLNMADVHLVLQKKNAADLMLPSKLTGILSSGGLALVTADQGTSLYKVVVDHEMGIVIPSEDETALKVAILDCCVSDHTSETVNGRWYAEKYLNKNNIISNVMLYLKEPSLVDKSILEYLDLRNA
ncbi:WcaI family glycosyltransferase [Arcticibacter eurypsychrophilus]|uniref:WcaI family glycosyltransferase n=1 Tax=Arcticibacter eurypsychrophilus TaxID=1434752 RepID=UPI000AD49258|nr:WcaI family glycosyltransferase [Arcticibacter eurypsychrophilus]